MMIAGGLQLSWADHLIAFLITFVVPAYALLRSQPALKDLELNERMRISLYYSNSAGLFVLALIVGITWVAQGRSLSELGFGGPVQGTMWVQLVLLFMVLYIVDVLVNTVVKSWRDKRKALWREMTAFMPRNDRELYHFSITVALSAAFCEEVIYRGFFIQYSLAFLPNTMVGEYSAVILPAFVFAAVHKYQGWAAVLKIFILACVFGFVFVLSQSLWPLILLHYLIDIVGAMLGRYVFFRRQSD